MLALFAACAPGLEPWLRTELVSLGAADVAVTPGGVQFAGDDAVLYRVALESGLASALRVRLGAFAARRFEQVVRGVAALPWADWLAPGEAVEVKVTTRKSRLYHSTAVAERVREGLDGATDRRVAAPADAGSAAWSVVVRLVDDRCTVSLDVSGAPLYRRGYREATAKAPLRPDLARALLVVSGWNPDSALIDPFCGAGTLCIEAAALACRLPPGRLRTFAFMRSPRFRPMLWDEVRTAALAGVRPAPAPICGSDRDPGAIRAATENAARAGVDVDWEHAPLRQAAALRHPPSPPGLWASNPPYGRRTGDVTTLRNLYQTIGSLRARLPAGWRLALVVADPKLARAAGVPLTSAVMTDHGGVKVRLMVESAASDGCLQPDDPRDPR